MRNKTDDTKQSAWKNAKNVADILIKKACEHNTCPHGECKRTDLFGGAPLEVIKKYVESQRVK
jgi:hypothetical protein